MDQIVPIMKVIRNQSYILKIITVNSEDALSLNSYTSGETRKEIPKWLEDFASASESLINSDEISFDNKQIVLKLTEAAFF